jgi:hypothetical protein
MIDGERARALLSALGETAVDVAENLRRRGIRGDRCSPTTCPLARYLRSEGIERVSVGSTSLWEEVSGLEFPPPEEYVKYADITGAERFRHNFDNNLYPDLIEGE